MTKRLASGQLGFALMALVLVVTNIQGDLPRLTLVSPAEFSQEAIVGRLLVSAEHPLNPYTLNESRIYRIKSELGRSREISRPASWMAWAVLLVTPLRAQIPAQSFVRPPAYLTDTSDVKKASVNQWVAEATIALSAAQEADRLAQKYWFDGERSTANDRLVCETAYSLAIDQLRVALRSSDSLEFQIAQARGDRSKTKTWIVDADDEAWQHLRPIPSLLDDAKTALRDAKRTDVTPAAIDPHIPTGKRVKHTLDLLLNPFKHYDEKEALFDLGSPLPGIRSRTSPSLGIVDRLYLTQLLFDRPDLSLKEIRERGRDLNEAIMELVSAIDQHNQLTVPETMSAEAKHRPLRAQLRIILAYAQRDGALKNLRDRGIPAWLALRIASGKPPSHKARTPPTFPVPYQFPLHSA